MNEISTAHVSGTRPLTEQPSDPPTRTELYRKAKVRKVTRMVALYVRTKYTIGSISGPLAIHDTRVSRPRKGETIDLDGSPVEVLDRIHNEIVRRAVTAPPDKRRDVKYVGGENDGLPMRTVIARRYVALMTAGKSTRVVNMSADVRDWRATVAQKLAAISREQAAALLDVATLRDQLVEIGNRLEAARRDLGRLKGGGKSARYLRQQAEDRVAALRQDEVTRVENVRRIERSRVYSDGITNLYDVCSASPDVASYCFRDKD